MDSGLLGADDSVAAGSVEESRQMELARLHNVSMQRKLEHNLGELQQDADVQLSRLAVEQLYIQRALEDLQRMRRGEQRRLVLPRGLSQRHVAMIKEQREQETIKSISLDEFDKKMERLRGQRTVCRSVLLSYRNRQRLKKTKKAKRALQPPPELEERCTNTNVHFDLYLNAERDQHLQYELTFLSRIKLPNPPPPAVFKGFVAKKEAGEGKDDKGSEGQLAALAALGSSREGAEEEGKEGGEAGKKKDSRELVRGHTLIAPVSSMQGLPPLIDPSPGHEDAKTRGGIEPALTLPALSPESPPKSRGSGGSSRMPGSSRRLHVSKYHVYRASAHKMPKAGRVQGLRADSLNRGKTFI